jgi:iron complex outermembrane receptor protein
MGESDMKKKVDRPFIFAKPLALAITSILLCSHAAAEDKTLAPVKVRSTTVPSGTAKQGYKVETIRQLGPLGEVDVLNTPFSLTVISSEMMENVQASKPDDVFKMIPVLQLNNPQTRFFTGAHLRGFSVASTKRLDGLPSTSSYVNVDIEDKDRIEIITGLSGFLYGSGNVGGTINYVFKRPTVERLNKVSVGITEGENFLVHGDFGGRIDSEGKFGYRLNVVAQDGDTAMDHQSLERQLFSGALDWNVTDDLQLQFDASKSRYRLEGSEPFWTITSGATVHYPSAPDVDDYFGQKFSRTDTDQERVGVRLNWRLNDAVSFRAAAARHESELHLVASNNTFSATVPNVYVIQATEWEYPDVEATAGLALFDIHFATGGVEHLVTTGWYGDRDERTNFRSPPAGWAALTSGPVNLNQGPVYLQNPGFDLSAVQKYTAQRSHYDNWIVGDQITFNQHWSALLGVTRVGIKDTSYALTGPATARYDDSEITPSAALMYKPVPDITVYLSYAESLEKGGTAPQSASTTAGPNTRLVNRGEVMAPLQSEQIEVGIKANAGGMLLTLALFEIDKALQYIDVSVPALPRFVQDGREVHKGAEFTATGKMFDRLTVFGGITVFDAEIKENAANPRLEGQTPTNVAEQMAKLYVEYDLASMPGLTLTGGAYYTGEQYVDQYNTDKLPSYTTFDLGARYSVTAANTPLVFRLGINNVTEKNYWINTNNLGRARTVSASVQASF